MKLKAKQLESDALDLTPLIDIIFQLVLFFMIASTFVDDYGFNIVLPEVEKPEVISSEQAITVLLPRNAAFGLQPGEPAYDDTELLVAELRRFASDRQAEGKSAVAVIKADRNVPYERVIQAWNAIRKAGIPNISFRLESKKGSQGAVSP